LDRSLGGPQSQSGHSGEKKNSQPLPGLEPLIIQPIAQCYTTELSLFTGVRNSDLMRAVVNLFALLMSLALLFCASFMQISVITFQVFRPLLERFGGTFDYKIITRSVNGFYCSYMYVERTTD
jgi:hypothetical protein